MIMIFDMDKGCVFHLVQVELTSFPPHIDRDVSLPERVSV